LVGSIPVLRLLQLAGRPAPYFGHLLGAFREVFYWVQKTTLSSSQPLGKHLCSSFCTLRVAQRRTLAICWGPSKKFSTGLESDVNLLFGSIPVLRRLLQLSGRPAPYFGHLPGAFRKVFYWV
jgi:hypothetical protein